MESAARVVDLSADKPAASCPYPLADQETAEDRQPALFESPIASARIIPFDSLTTRAERRSIRARAAGLERPAPVKTEKVQVKRARRNKAQTEQTSLDFHAHEDVHPLPQSNIICDAPVAPVGLRAQAALIDFFYMLAPCIVSAGLFRYVAGDDLSLDKHVLPFLVLALATVPFFYRFLWTVAGRDTIGMRMAGLLLVDFDGNPPSRSRRYARLLGGFLSFLAAGIGLIWPLVDEDRLTWHDHISSTFPTVAE